MTDNRTDPVAEQPFQESVRPWLLACFGEMIAGDREERNHRFLEEALELVQACGCTVSEAHQLVDYVYGRPVGELHQEVGGVMVTLAALCLANDADMAAAGWAELNRVWGKVEAIRAKQAAKPKHSPLPQESTPQPDTEAAIWEGWQSIASAPVRTPLEVQVGHMVIVARLIPDASMTSKEEACDQWQAEYEGEHPPCWSGGACWETNEDEVCSLQPTGWRFPANIRQASHEGAK